LKSASSSLSVVVFNVAEALGGRRFDDEVSLLISVNVPGNGIRQTKELIDGFPG
jgi:hypothetical protein